MRLVVVAVAELARSRSSAVAIEVGANTAKTGSLVEDTSVRREVAAVDPTGAVTHSYTYRSIKVKLAYGSEEQLRHALNLQDQFNANPDLHLCWENTENCPYVHHAFLDCAGDPAAKQEFGELCAAEAKAIRDSTCDGGACHFTTGGDNGFKLQAIPVVHRATILEFNAANVGEVKGEGAVPDMKVLEFPTSKGTRYLWDETTSGDVIEPGDTIKRILVNDQDKDHFEPGTLTVEFTKDPERRRPDLAFRTRNGNFYFDESTATWDKACRLALERGQQAGQQAYACADPANGRQRDLYEALDAAPPPKTGDLKALCSTAPECEYTYGALSSLLQRLGMEAARLKNETPLGPAEQYEMRGGLLLWQMMIQNH